MKKNLVAFLCVFAPFLSVGQFALKDSLRGGLRVERTCFDVIHYDLSVAINSMDSSISGENTITFKGVENSKVMQLDLYRNLEIDSVVQAGVQLKYIRKEDAFFVYLNKSLTVGVIEKLTVYYKGNPTVAVHAPWDGGFVWKEDSLGRPFIGVACEGMGASSWWPNKDHLSDKPDSMDIHFTVPKPFKCIANGIQLEKTSFVEDSSLHTFNWHVSYPIINYNVTFYIGAFVKISDYYLSNSLSNPLSNSDTQSDTLQLNYFVLDYNKKRAIQHFKQVKPMLKIYEELFGRYPFWKDGYKLVEAPYLGMEHQSAIAYGNKFQKGYLGRYLPGYEFDYVIIHETGHEYWGNSVSMQDLADMWIHEAFCTYTEALYVEKVFGYDKMVNYVQKGSKRIRNDKAIIGHYHVNNMGSSDMYMKGSVLLHSLRTFVDNDSLWFATLKEIQSRFAYQSINSEDIFESFERTFGAHRIVFFKYFLQTSTLPTLIVSKGEKKKIFNLRWKNVPDGFTLPVAVRVKNNVHKVLVDKTGVNIQTKKRRLKHVHPVNDFGLFKIEYE